MANSTLSPADRALMAASLGGRGVEAHMMEALVVARSATDHDSTVSARGLEVDGDGLEGLSGVELVEPRAGPAAVDDELVGAAEA